MNRQHDDEQSPAAVLWRSARSNVIIRFSCRSFDSSDSVDSECISSIIQRFRSQWLEQWTVFTIVRSLYRAGPNTMSWSRVAVPVGTARRSLECVGTSVGSVDQRRVTVHQQRRPLAGSRSSGRTVVRQSVVRLTIRAALLGRPSDSDVHHSDAAMRRRPRSNAKHRSLSYGAHPVQSDRRIHEVSDAFTVEQSPLNIQRDNLDNIISI